ncbi:MAG: class I SAM-dependent methyltransferase [archaeon]|nr:class I SAM-dependent methyltransferase [archaeon]
MNQLDTGRKKIPCAKCRKQRNCSMFVDYVNFHKREERTEYIFNNFKKYFGTKILDVGCDKAVLKTLIKDIEYVGIDIGGTPDICINLEKIQCLPFDDESFDCVVCADVLEHIDNLHLIFSELLRVCKKYTIIAWPNNWVSARLPIERGHGSFKHYGLPVEKPQDRHKWFFSFVEAKNFIHDYLNNRNDIQLAEERISEKTKFQLFRLLRHMRYPKPNCYFNRYAHTYWTVLEKI